MPIASIEHIEIDDKGTARIAGNRSRVVNIVIDALNGMTPAQIHEQYPHLSLAQIHSALAYYYDHKPQMDEQIQRELAEYIALRGKSNQPSRDELLRRLPSGSEPRD